MFLVQQIALYLTSYGYSMTAASYWPNLAIVVVDSRGYFLSLR
jgi:hypothetical protein